jgi:Ca2+-binding RTX toxin-like protein
MNMVGYGSFFSIGHVIVYSQGGNDIIKTAAQTLGGSLTLTYVSVPLLIFAGGGTDILNVSGSSVGNVLVGGGGSDRLIGGQGRDILIGGAGLPMGTTLQAGNPPATNLGQGGAILIGGTTNYDSDAVALAAFLAEWSSSDDYATRVNVLSASLNATTVHEHRLDNQQIDKLYGGTGMDWYFAGMMDMLLNKTTDEVVTQI